MENVLNYALHENKLTKDDPDDYYAVPIYTGTVTEDDLIVEMTASGSTLTKGEAKLFLEQYKQAIHKKLLAGYTVNTGLFNIAPRIVGVFRGRSDKYDRARHAVSVYVNAGVDLKTIEPNFNPSIVEATKALPDVADFKDVASGLFNQLITIGGVGQITGHRLLFDETDTAQGIFFVADNNQAVRVTAMVRHKPSELIFMIPTELTAGNYYIEVRTVPTGNKEIRTGRYRSQLPSR